MNNSVLLLGFGVLCVALGVSVIWAVLTGRVRLPERTWLHVLLTIPHKGTEPLIAVAGLLAIGFGIWIILTLA